MIRKLFSYRIVSYAAQLGNFYNWSNTESENFSAVSIHRNCVFVMNIVYILFPESSYNCASLSSFCSYVHVKILLSGD